MANFRTGGIATTTKTASILPANAVILVETMLQSNGGGTSSYSTDWDLDVNPYLGLEQDCFIWDRVGRPERFTKETVTSVPDAIWRPLTLGYGASPLVVPSWDDPNPTSLGLELGLAKYLRHFFERPVLVNKVFRGGTKLTDTGPGSYDWNSRSGPKDESMWEIWRDTYHAIATGEIANDTPYAGRPIYHVGIVYFQGAADSNVSGDAATYEANLLNLVADTRSYLGITAPFAVGRSEDYFAPGGGFVNNHDYIGTIRDAQVSVADATADCEWFSTDSVPFVTGDAEHFNGDAQRMTGYRAGVTLGAIDSPVLYIASA